MHKKPKTVNNKPRMTLKLTHSLSARMSPNNYLQKQSILSFEMDTIARFSMNQAKSQTHLKKNTPLKKKSSPKSNSPIYNKRNNKSPWKQEAKGLSVMRLERKKNPFKQNSELKERLSYLNTMQKQILKLKHENKHYKTQAKLKTKIKQTALWESIKKFKSKLQSKLKLNN